MRRTITFTAALVLLVADAPAAYAADTLPAFPGAKGFGATSLGARSARVIKVTDLNARGPGSLQASCSAQGPRIVVFDLGGVIPGDVVIEHGRISIMEQMAPGAGVTIEGMLSTRYNPPQPIDDVVVRFVRVRPTGARAASQLRADQRATWRSGLDPSQPLRPPCPPRIWVFSLVSQEKRR